MHTVSPNSCARPWRAVPDAHTRVASGASAPERIAVTFARALRGAGVEIPVGATLTFTQALGLVGLTSRSGVYWAGRATLVNRPEDVGMFDRAFAVFWDRRQAGPDATELPPEEVIIALDVPGADDSNDDDVIMGSDAPVVTLRFSAREILRHRDFTLYTPAEFVEARRMMSDLRLVGAGLAGGLAADRRRAPGGRAGARGGAVRPRRGNALDPHHRGQDRLVGRDAG